MLATPNTECTMRWIRTIGAGSHPLNAFHASSSIYMWCPVEYVDYESWDHCKMSTPPPRSVSPVCQYTFMKWGQKSWRFRQECMLNLMFLH